MHIPDGFVDARTAVATGLIAGAGVGVALREVRRSLPPSRMPLLGVSAAFLFAAQMLNFPVAAGTSGHLVGGVLAVALLGPAAAVIVMTTVVVVQCLLFGDGGVTALGANVLNMAVVAPLVGYLPYRMLGRLLPGERGRAISIGVAAWLSIVVASILCAGELAFSGTASWSAVFPAMAGTHMLIGVGEAVITALVLSSIAHARPELLAGPDRATSPAPSGTAGFAAVIAVALAVFVAPFASPWPDGLEHVADRLGFGTAAAGPFLQSPLTDYALPGVTSPAFATIAAGLVGAVIVFLLSFVLGRALVPKTRGRTR